MRGILAVLVGSAAIAAGCSAGKGASTPPAPSTGGSGGSAGASGAAAGALALAGSAGQAEPGGAGGQVSSGGGAGGVEVPACAAEFVDSHFTPVNFVIAVDRSGSMDRSSRWTSVATGIGDFVAEPRSVQLRASLGLFPYDDPTCATEEACIASACDVGNYDPPRVRLTALSSPSAITSALSNTLPGGGTPTLPALQAAAGYAASVQASHQDDRTVVVLITDGAPQFYINATGQYEPGCDNNNFGSVAGAARSAYTNSGLLTYVVGIGSDLSLAASPNVNDVASAGGTTMATLISDANAQQAASAVRRAFESIRDAYFTCNLAVPDRPSGDPLDPSHTNLAFVDTTGERIELPYAPGCTDGVGWRYDDVASPTGFELCARSCNQVQTDPVGKVRVEFGCPTTGLVGAGGAGGGSTGGTGGGSTGGSGGGPAAGAGGAGGG